jgi:hypothetical protein
MTNPQIENAVINHLEFLGYGVNYVPVIGVPEGMRMLRAEHPSGGSINIMLFEGVINFSIWFSLNDFAMVSRQSLLEAVNDLNRQFETRYHLGDVEGVPAFFCNLSYRGPYEKRVFGQFVNVWQREMQALWGTGIMKFLA